MCGDHKNLLTCVKLLVCLNEALYLIKVYMRFSTSIYYSTYCISIRVYKRFSQPMVPHEQGSCAHISVTLLLVTSWTEFLMHSQSEIFSPGYSLPPYFLPTVHIYGMGSVTQSDWSNLQVLSHSQKWLTHTSTLYCRSSRHKSTVAEASENSSRVSVSLGASCYAGHDNGQGLGGQAASQVS